MSTCFFKSIAASLLLAVVMTGAAYAEDAASPSMGAADAQRNVMGLGGEGIDLNNMGQMMNGGALAGIRNPVPLLASARGPSVFLFDMSSLYSGIDSEPVGGDVSPRKTLIEQINAVNKARRR